MVSCRNCQTENLDGALRCKHCGMPLSQPIKPSQEDSKPNYIGGRYGNVKGQPKGREQPPRNLLKVLSEVNLRHRIAEAPVKSAAAIIVVAILILVLLLNPLTSPFASFHDADVDGYPDSADLFPNDPTRWKSNSPEDALRAYMDAWNDKDGSSLIETTVCTFYKPAQVQYLLWILGNTSHYGSHSITILNTSNRTLVYAEELMASERNASLELGLGMTVQDYRVVVYKGTYYVGDVPYSLNATSPCLMIGNWWYLDVNGCNQISNRYYSPTAPDGNGALIS
jgi:hypothetical protein